MTITSARLSGRVDLAAFDLSDDDISSLRAIAAEWMGAVDELFANRGDNPAARAFVDETRLLAAQLGDAEWQDRWLRCWQKLYGQGFPSATLFALMNGALDLAEQALFASDRPASPIRIALFALLRRAVLAILSCAVDLTEEASLLQAGVPGELAALRYLWEMAGQGKRLAVLSVSVSNRDAFVHLSANDLQSYPEQVAGRMQSLLRAEDRLFAGRDGEWLLVLPEIRSLTQPALAGAYVERAFAQPLRLASGKALTFEVAIGAALLPDHGADPEAVLAASRLARWHLLASRQTFGWFRPDIQVDWNKHHELAAEFKAALDQETLQLFIQPQIESDSGLCVGGELLLRWWSARGEWIDPQLAMELVDENGWRHLFTDWLFRCALRISADLAAAGVDFRLSLNLTAGDLLDEDLVDMIAQRLETWQISGERFTLELTESAMMVDHQRCLDSLFKLRRLGFRLALDDFGTGYSSLSYLVTLPINELKIDRSFIVAMTESAERRRIVRTIVDLARDLEMTPLAEGVESTAQVDVLRSLGCTRIQGFIYGKPMAEDDFMAWWQSRQT